jgi:hypothetical protein
MVEDYLGRIIVLNWVGRGYMPKSLYHIYAFSYIVVHVVVKGGFQKNYDIENLAKFWKKSKLVRFILGKKKFQNFTNFFPKTKKVVVLTNLFELP